MEVQAVVSGLFTASFALGNFCGPTLSGIIYDAVGFSYNSLVLQALVVVVLMLNTVCYCFPEHRADYEAIPDTPRSSYSCADDRRDSVFPELPADVIRSRPTSAPPRRKHRKYSTSSSVYERSVVF